MPALHTPERTQYLTDLPGKRCIVCQKSEFLLHADVTRRQQEKMNDFLGQQKKPPNSLAAAGPIHRRLLVRRQRKNALCVPREIPERPRERAASTTRRRQHAIGAVSCLELSAVARGTACGMHRGGGSKDVLCHSQQVSHRVQDYN